MSQLLDIYIEIIKKNHKEKNDLKRKKEKEKKEYSNKKQFVGIMLILSFFGNRLGVLWKLK